MPHDGVLNSPFGARRSYNGGPARSHHSGVDLDGDGGEPIRPSADGIVVLAEQLQVRGNTIIIDHGWGVYSLYAHLSKIQVQPGERVARGDTIGLLGSTGLATGPHLHWEIRVNGTPVDPIAWCERQVP